VVHDATTRGMHRATRRRRVHGSAATIVAGVVAAGAGLVLLLAPAAPIEARAGSVLEGPAVSSADDGASSSGREAAPAATPAPGVTVAPGVPEETPRLPLPVLQGFVPDRIVVEALDVDASLVTTLVDADGVLVPPEDPEQLGWWRGVRPGGGRGSVVVAGHIDSTRFGQGPLARLVDLDPGDRAVVTGPDGARVDYVVRGIETFPKESLPAAELFTAGGSERLVLVTCGGRFDRGRGSWDSNIVAVLDRVPVG
jgi:Sortase domain